MRQTSTETDSIRNRLHTRRWCVWKEWGGWYEPDSVRVTVIEKGGRTREGVSHRGQWGWDWGRVGDGVWDEVWTQKGETRGNWCRFTEDWGVEDS